MVKLSQTGGTLLDKIVDFIIPPKVVGFLNIVIYEKRFIIINYWSFVHFFAGVIFYFFFPTKFILWIWINIIFEAAEYILALGGNPLFVEELFDTIWDILLSLLGFLIASWIVGIF
jgi:hypothetical protein